MHRLLLAFSTGLLIIGMGACGAVNETTPVACLEGRGAYLAALGQAPDAVLLGDETPISACLVENQTGGELATVGTATVAAATRLNSEARADPDGDAAFRLGYLVGAAERGAGETEGIHADLLRRLRAAALYSPADRGLPATALSSYRRGLEAGLAGG